jgi:hypothetical protein
MIIELEHGYFIQLDTNGNYTLYQAKTVKNGKTKGDDYDDAIGFYSSVPSALNRYAKHLLSSKGETVTIGEYLRQYNEIVEKLIANTLPKEVK